MMAGKYSIKSQLLLALMIVIIPFIAMSVINFQYSISTMTGKITESRLRVLTETAQNMEQLFSSIESRARQVRFDVNVQKILLKDFTNEYEDYQMNDQVQKMLQSITFSWEYLKSIYVVPTKAIVRGKSTTSGLINNSNMGLYTWYADVDKKSTAKVWIPTRISEEDNLPAENIYTYILPITNLRNDKDIIGHALINIKEISLYSILRSNDMDKHEKIYLLDENNRIFYNSDRVYEQKPIESDISSLAGSKNLSGHFFTGSGKDKMLITYTTVPKHEWKLISRVPYSNIVMELKQLEKVSFTVILACITVSLIMAFVLYSGITKPLNGITARIVNIGHGDFTPQEYNVNTKNEIEKIINNFNWMSKRIAQLIENNNLVMVQKREAELKALQSQINPHFLYNTLDTVNWLALMNKQEEISEMVKNLSQFYRSSLSNGKEMISIEEEILHVKAFVDIEKFSSRNRFEVIYNLDKRLFKYTTIKLILQPFVENALIHGLKETDGKGRICIQLYSNQNTIYFEIIDNGQGIEQEQINRILKEKIVGYGVANVDERIRLKYGDSYGVSFKSKIGAGTTAVISIPKDEPGQEESRRYISHGEEGSEGCAQAIDR